MPAAPQTKPSPLGTISPGDLVQFSSRATNRYFFIGPLIKKPIVQVLIEAHLDAAGGANVSVLPREATDNAIPDLCTSQQLFQGLLEAAGRLPFDSIPFRVCEYRVVPHQSALSVVLVEVGGERLEISHKPPARRTSKPKGNIAFGLKRPKAKKTTEKTTKRPKTANAPDNAPCESHVAEASSSSSSDSSDDSSSSSSSGSSSDSDSGQEAEHKFRTSSEKAEEKETTDILRDHFQESSNPASSRKDAPQPQSQTQKPAAVAGKTQCNPKVGVVEVSVQRANRLAKCRFCVQAIAKGVTRIGYAYSKMKFHAYVHHSCFSEFLAIEKGSVPEALAFFSQWILKVKAGSASSNAKDVLPDSAIENVEALIQQLRAKSAEASSSHG